MNPTARGNCGVAAALTAGWDVNVLRSFPAHLIKYFPEAVIFVIKVLQNVNQRV